MTVHNLIFVFSGQTLTIEAAGTLHEKIEKGATVLLEVKYGLITLIRQTVDLCEQIENVDLHCPLEKGDMVLKKQVELPKQIPPVSGSKSRYLQRRELMGLIRVNTLFTPISTTTTGSRLPASKPKTLNSSSDAKLYPLFTVMSNTDHCCRLLWLTMP